MIAVPSPTLHPLTASWAAEHGATLCHVDRPDGYWEALAVLWTIPGDLVVVEHDMLPAPGVTETMAACRRPWCTSPYRVEAGMARESLGCTRFAARLKTRHPNLMGRLGEIGDELPAKDWRRLDVRLARLLRDLGYRAHTHRLSAHLHNYT